MTTVTNMWDQAKDLADMTGSGFPVEARGINYANTALRILHVALANAHNGDYFRSEDTITIVADTEEYALPADFMRSIKMVFEPANGNRRYPVKKFNLEEMSGMRKAPLTAGTIIHWYAPTPTVFTLVADTLAAIYPVGSSDFIAYHMAIQLLNREESFEQAQLLSRERDLVMRSIMDIIEPRDEQPEEVVDVYGRWTANHRRCAVEDQSYLYRIMGGYVYLSEVTWRA
ncbi:MAG: hypothetical protein JRH20_24770 [Deltaproteobacteria bacterium]|nr:hypothetical protein [Deltaproteobacteria bacterium]